MRHSNLFDKNGIEILEGQKINIKVPDWRTGKTLVKETCDVVFETGCFGVHWGNRKEFTTFGGFIRQTEFEVV